MLEGAMTSRYTQVFNLVCSLFLSLPLSEHIEENVIHFEQAHRISMIDNNCGNSPFRWHIGTKKNNNNEMCTFFEIGLPTRTRFSWEFSFCQFLFCYCNNFFSSSFFFCFVFNSWQMEYSIHKCAVRRVLTHGTSPLMPCK